MEDGRGRCPFDPEYKSSAIMVGKYICSESLVIVWVSHGFLFGSSMADSWFIWFYIHYLLNPSVSVPDGDMYGGTVSTFQGNEPIIYKSEDSKITLKTETSLNWLQGWPLIYFFDKNVFRHNMAFDRDQGPLWCMQNLHELQIFACKVDSNFSLAPIACTGC